MSNYLGKYFLHGNKAQIKRVFALTLSFNMFMFLPVLCSFTSDWTTFHPTSSILVHWHVMKVQLKWQKRPYVVLCRHLLVLLATATNYLKNLLRLNDWKV